MIFERKMFMKKLSFLLVAVLLVIALVSCNNGMEIDNENNKPNNTDLENTDTENTDNAVPPSEDETEIKTEKVTLTLYFPDNDALYLHPEIREVEISENEFVEDVIVRELFRGPESEGLSPSLSGEDLVNDIVVNDDGGCVIDFKSDFVLLNTGGSTRETFVLGSIVNSLCELEFIDSVSFTVEGKGNVEFGHTIIDSALKPMPELVKN